MMTTASVVFRFRDPQPSGRGKGCVRYLVDANLRYIGFVEGKKGAWFDSDLVCHKGYSVMIIPFKTRQRAAEALWERVEKATS